MNGTQEAQAGAPLAAHFEAKRRILATVKQMEERGEKLEEATLDEVLEAASKAEQTVFKFDFSVSGGQDEEADETTGKKRSRNRKRSKKRRAKKPQDDKNADGATARSAPVTPAQRGNARDANVNGATKQKMQPATTVKAARGGPSSTSSSFLKLRKATGTESEVAKMHLRYGQGRRNLAASKQREQRKKATDEHKKTDEFKFNFEASS
jgi:hypothetical protein